MLINNCITLWHPEKHGLISFKKATSAETWESNLNCKKTSLNSLVRCTKCKYLQEHECVLNIQSFHYFHTVHVNILLYSSVLTLCLSVLVSLLLQIDKERWIDTSMRFLFSPDVWKHVQTIANWGKKTSLIKHARMTSPVEIEVNGAPAAGLSCRWRCCQGLLSIRVESSTKTWRDRLRGT